METRIKLDTVMQTKWFPEVDVALRRGVHLSQADGERYQFIRENEQELRQFYRLYRFDLIVNDVCGYCYLDVGSSSVLGKAKLASLETLCGICLCAAKVDETRIATNQACTAVQVLEKIRSLAKVWMESDIHAKKYNQLKTDHDYARFLEDVEKGLNKLAKLGFASKNGKEFYPTDAVFRFYYAIPEQEQGVDTSKKTERTPEERTLHA